MARTHNSTGEVILIPVPRNGALYIQEDGFVKVAGTLAGALEYTESTSHCASANERECECARLCGNE